MDSAFLTLIRWIVIYSVDSVIQLSNNWSQKVRRSTAEAYNPEASKFLLSVYNHARVFYPTQPSNQKYGKIFCPNMESENSSFELATLVHVCLQPKEIVSWHKR